MIDPERSSIICSPALATASLGDALQHHTIVLRSVPSEVTTGKTSRATRAKRVMSILQEALDLIDSIEMESKEDCILPLSTSKAPPR